MYLRKIIVSLFLISSSTPVFAANFSLSELISLFGVTGFIIVCLSILIIAVVMERFRNLRKALVVPDKLSMNVSALWKENKHTEIQNLCEQDASALSRVYAYISRHRHHNFDLVSTGAGDIASMALRKHMEKAYPLAVVATISPLAGLLGTVIGMIEAFYVVAATGAVGDASILAGGIYKALFTTAAGLFVALPALGFHHYFKSKITFYSFAIEEQINEFISQWFSTELAGETPSNKNSAIDKAQNNAS